MAIETDFTIDYVNKRIAHSTNQSGEVHTVNALYSYLQNTFDDLDQMDDPVPMSAQTPTEYTLINGWFMNEARENEGGSYYRNCFEYLKTGAVTTTGQDDEIRILPLAVGGTNADAGDIGLPVEGAVTTHDGTLLDYDNTNNEWWIRMITSADLFDNGSEGVSVTGGTGSKTMTAVSTTGENLWANIYTLGTIEQSTGEEQIYVEQDGSRIFSGAEWWPEDKAASSTRHIDILLKVKESDTFIDGGDVTVYLRNYPAAGNADLYDHFGIDLDAGGRNAVPLATSVDLNNTTAATAVAVYSGITVAFVNGTVAYDGISGSFTEFDTVTWAGGSGIFLAQSTASGAGTMTLGNVSSEYPVDTETITAGANSASAGADMVVAYTMDKAFEQGTPYPYSVIIGCNSFTLGGVYEYLKYLTRLGSTTDMFPTSSTDGPVHAYTTKEGQLYIRAHEDNQTSATNTFSPVKASPFGTFAGGTFFGAQGVWIQSMATADIQNFQLIDSDGDPRTPPNQQSVTIGNTISGDRVAVYRALSDTQTTTIHKSIYTAAANNTTGSTTFVVTEDIASDTPSGEDGNLGVVRVVDISDTTSAREARYTYSSWDTKTFTLASGSLGRTFTQTDDTAYVPFIDQVATETSTAVTVIYTEDRTLIVRVRRYAATAILPFELTGITFASNGYSTSTIRTSDTIVTVI